MPRSENHVRLNQLVRLIEEYERCPLTGFEVRILGHKPGRPDGIRIHSAPPAGHSLEMIEEGDDLGARTTVRDGGDLTRLHTGDAESIAHLRRGPAAIGKNGRHIVHDTCRRVIGCATTALS